MVGVLKIIIKFCYAYFLAVFLCIVNMYSVKVSAWMMTALTFLKLLVLSFVIALGVWHFIDKGMAHAQYHARIMSVYLK